MEIRTLFSKVHVCENKEHLSDYVICRQSPFFWCQKFCLVDFSKTNQHFLCVYVFKNELSIIQDSELFWQKNQALFPSQRSKRELCQFYSLWLNALICFKFSCNIKITFSYRIYSEYFLASLLLQQVLLFTKYNFILQICAGNKNKLMYNLYILILL